MSRIHLSPPDVGQVEEDYLLTALRSGWVAPLGPDVDAFEAELAATCQRAHCVALSSGTAALHLGLLGLGVGRGDLVLTASMTFAATANAISYTGAEPVFIDSDETGNLNPALLAQALDDLDDQQLTVAAIVPVDLLGKVATHEEIARLARERDIPVLSDAAESLGATRAGRPAASYGDAAVVSFNGNKVMTTSGGGALLTDDPALAATARHLATQARQPALHYEHTEIGYNYRLSNLLAALGRAQLTRLDSMIERRRRLRVRYRDAIAGVQGVRLFGEPSGMDGGATRDNFWLTSLIIDPDRAGFEAADLIAALATHDIEARPLWKPMHLQPVFTGCRSYLDGTSERLFSTGLSLPSGSGMPPDHLERVLAAVAEFFEGRPS